MLNSPNINQSPMINKPVSKSVQTQAQTPAVSNIPQQQVPQYTTNIYPTETVPIYSKTATPAPEVSNPTVTHSSWFYINDVHGKMTNMERIYNISQEFDRLPAKNFAKDFYTNSTDNVSKFKVSSGDIILGANYTSNQVASQFLNWSGFIASALGNHEVDVTNPTNLAKLLNNANYKMLAINVDIDKNSPLNGKIEKSTIIEKDGIKYGLIGIAPPDMLQRVKMNDTLKDFTIYDSDKTIKVVQEEVNRLTGLGIKHIAILSHAGIKNDKRLAQETSGIDLIFGAHTHDLIQGIEEGKNLFYSKAGEPVIITQAGKDGETVGILNVDFDQNGIIQKAQNNIIKTSFFDVQVEFGKTINFKIEWDNKLKNKLWQVKFNLPKKITETQSEDANLLIKRKFNPDYDIRENLPDRKGLEAWTNTAPMQRFVWANGFGVITKGLTEYEVSKNSLKITLLRSTGIISNPKNPSRSTPAGPPFEVPDAQQLGYNCAEFSVAFFEPENYQEYINIIFPNY